MFELKNYLHCCSFLNYRVLDKKIPVIAIWKLQDYREFCPVNPGIKILPSIYSSKYITKKKLRFCHYNVWEPKKKKLISFAPTSYNWIRFNTKPNFLFSPIFTITPLFNPFLADIWKNRGIFEKNVYGIVI